jgi:hypothetical protein
MLIVRDSDDVWDSRDALWNAGYGYSVLDEPAAAAQFDLQSYQEMFSDWGWSGAPDKRPGWMEKSSDPKE